MKSMTTHKANRVNFEFSNHKIDLSWLEIVWAIFVLFSLNCLILLLGLIVGAINAGSLNVQSLDDLLEVFTSIISIATFFTVLVTINMLRKQNETALRSTQLSVAEFMEDRLLKVISREVKIQASRFSDCNRYLDEIKKGLEEQDLPATIDVYLKFFDDKITQPDASILPSIYAIEKCLNRVILETEAAGLDIMENMTGLSSLIQDRLLNKVELSTI